VPTAGVLQVIGVGTASAAAPPAVEAWLRAEALLDSRPGVNERGTTSAVADGSSQGFFRCHPSGEKRRYCPGPIGRPLSTGPIPSRPVDSRPGGGKRKLSASRERPIPAHTAGRAGRHSNGTVGREAALPHGVTREQRMLNPLLWQVCGTLGRFRCHAGQAVVRARVPASPSRASRLARTRDGRRDLRPVRPFPPTRPSSTPGGASNRRANCRSGDALAPGATEHKSDYWLVVSAVCSSKSTTSH